MLPSQSQKCDSHRGVGRGILLAWTEIIVDFVHQYTPSEVTICSYSAFATADDGSSMTRDAFSIESHEPLQLDRVYCRFKRRDMFHLPQIEFLRAAGEHQRLH